MLCRLCLKDTSDVINMFEDDADAVGATYKRKAVATIVGKYFWFEPKSDDPISTSICNVCWLNLFKFDNFYNNIKQAQHEYQEKLSIKMEKSIGSEQSPPNKSEINEVYDDICKQEEVSLGSFHIIEDFLKIPMEYNIEADNLRISNNKIIKEREKLSKVNVNPLNGAMADNQLSENVDKVVVSAIADQYNILGDEQTKRKRGRPKKKVNIKTQRVLPTVTTNGGQTKNMEIDAEIAKHMPLHCELCNVVIKKFHNLKQHMRTKHNIIGYVICCGKKFMKRSLLLEHIRTHLNINSYKCHVCNKLFAKKQTHRKHCLTKHLDRFTTCKTCGMRFCSSEVLLAQNRDNKYCYGTMCDVCAKVIRGVAAFQQHRLEHLGIILPKIQCEDCGCWYKDKNVLSKHKEKYAQSNKKDVCGICQKVSPNRTALLNHIRYVHGRTRAFTCNICNKSFNKAIYLREHMAGHTGEVLYRCPHCPKTFNSSANMHSHRKKEHPKEFDELRKLRQQNAHLPSAPLPIMSKLNNTTEIADCI